MEIWKDIEGFEDTYQVSSYGNVRSLDRVILRSDGLEKRLKGRILKPRLGSNGYVAVQLSINNKPISREIHRLVAVHFIDNPENKREVNHKNGIKNDNRVNNLEWKTPKENQHHARSNGLINDCGENNTRAKLSNRQAQEIRELSGSMYQHEIGKMYGVSQGCVSQIILNKTYKNNYDSNKD